MPFLISAVDMEAKIRKGTFMIRIAVYHHKCLQRQMISKTLIEVLKDNKIYGKVYSVQDFHRFSESIEEGKYQFDILCIETSQENSKKLLARNDRAEYILIDTPINELSSYMKYKPVAWIQSYEDNQKKLTEALNACLFYLKKKQREYFYLHTKAKSMRIPYREILYFESRLHQVVIHTIQQSNLCAFPATLDDIEKTLPSERFIRCHQSFLVHIDGIYQLDRTNRSLILDNGESLGISKRYYKDVGQIFASETVI